LAVYEEEIDKIDKEIDELEEKIGHMDSNSASAMQSYRDMNEKMRAWETEIQAKVDKVKVQRNEHSQHTEAYNTVHQAVDYYQNCLNKVEAELAELAKKIDTYTTQVTELTKAADDMCPRITTKRTPKTIENEINQIEKQIEMTENMFVVFCLFVCVCLAFAPPL
jgi:chromosome segregation ATPase